MSANWGNSGPGFDYNMMTFVNHFRTHNIVFDAIIAIIISSIMPTILQFFKRIITENIQVRLQHIYDSYFNRTSNKYYTYIVSTTFTSVSTYDEKENNNSTTLFNNLDYIIIALLHKFRDIVIDNNYSEVYIYSGKKSTNAIKKDMYGHATKIAVDYSIDDKPECVYLPSSNKAYIKYDDNIDVCIQHSSFAESNSIASNIKIIISIRSCLPNASKYITNFVDRTVKEYNLSQNNIYIRTDLYIYNAATNPHRLDNMPKFETMLLNHNRCLKSVYTPHTERISTMLGHFQNRSGIYSNPNTIHKFGLLIHGPPGTGKTSMIKAIATQLNRSIVSITLDNICSDADLFTIISKGQFNIHQADIVIPVSKLIYVFEDIDTHISLNKRKLNKANIENVLKDGLNATAPASFKEDKYTFTLGGFLNVLDGIIEAENRVIIMTTNCLDKLDPAIYRPGRVNMCVKFGYIEDAAIFRDICQRHHPAGLLGNSESDIAALLESKSLKKTLFDSAIVNKEYDQRVEQSKDKIFTAIDSNSKVNTIVEEVIKESSTISSNSEDSNDLIKIRKEMYYKKLIELEHNKIIGLTASNLEAMCQESTSIADLHQKYFSDPL